ncbi:MULTISPECIES: PH domain-containing protein [unclassified Actinoplanes]|uniref:PH domain-containing protein n=1 Tax=unclassified Actinoplanes TaxID=2626549 RepID=UPI00031CF890|nr:MULTISPECIES: PH domain-containing protein [unclassified Actinoplanes]
MLDVNRLGPVLPRVRISQDGLLLRPWFRRALLVPWARIKGVRITPADRWSGKNAVPGGHGYYMVQIKLAGDWRRVGQALRVRHSLLPLVVRERLFGERGSWSSQEVILFSGYETIRILWENAGGESGDEDDNWPRIKPAEG